MIFYFLPKSSNLQSPNHKSFDQCNYSGMYCAKPFLTGFVIPWG